MFCVYLEYSNNKGYNVIDNCIICVSFETQIFSFYGFTFFLPGSLVIVNRMPVSGNVILFIAGHFRNIVFVFRHSYTSFPLESCLSDLQGRREPFSV